MTVDHYAGAGAGWAGGAVLVYGPIARSLIALCPHPLRGRTVLDAGAGTGVVSTAVRAEGGRPVAVDFSYDMLAWDAKARPAAAVADLYALPLARRSVDDTVAAFVLNHLVQPQAGLAELIRVTRPSGTVLACVYSNASRNAARDQVDAVAAQCGWNVPPWYLDIKATAAPLLGTVDNMDAAARTAGLEHVEVDERPVDVGVTEPEQLVDYRFGQAQFARWLDEIGPDRADEVRQKAAESIRPIMVPYRPTVVFLAARVPAN